jgi:hypothetical protein
MVVRGHLHNGGHHGFLIGSHEFVLSSPAQPHVRGCFLADRNYLLRHIHSGTVVEVEEEMIVTAIVTMVVCTALATYVGLRAGRRKS